MNKVQLMGRLGAAPEEKQFENGRKMAKFNLATNENYQTPAGEWKTDTCWHRIIAFGRPAEKAIRILDKGSEVMLTGKIVNGSYVNKDGQTVYTSEVEVYEIHLLDKANAYKKMESAEVAESETNDANPF